MLIWDTTTTWDQLAESCLDVVLKRYKKAQRGTGEVERSTKFSKYSYSLKLEHEILTRYNKGESVKGISEALGLTHSALGKFLKGRPRDIESKYARKDRRQGKIVI